MRGSAGALPCQDSIPLPGETATILPRHLPRGEAPLSTHPVILAPLGTDGDVIPYLGLGAVLRRRGHPVTLVAAEDYRDRAEAAGFAFRPLVTAEENGKLFNDPDFWHPLKGG